MGIPAEPAVRTEKRSGTAPSEQGSFRIVITSVGTGSPRLRHTLRRILPLSEPELVKLLYQAPSELVAGVRLELAERISALLRTTGLEVEIQSLDEPFTPGRGDLEVALVVLDVKRLSEVVALVATLLDTDEETAAKTVWSSPSILIGQVSAATVEALRRRFTPLGVELDVSRPNEATYDLFLGPCGDSVRAAVVRQLRHAGIEPSTPVRAEAPDAEPLLAMGLDRGRAQRVWDRVQRSSAPVRLVDRAFQRYDVRLDAASETDALIDFLVTDTGMPRDVAPKVIRSVPVVLHQNVTHARACASLEGLARTGARASAHLLTFQSLDIVIESLTDRAATARLFSALTSRPLDEAHSSLVHVPLRLEGPFSHLKARWLQQELRATGASAHLVLR